jgi:signal transduction histidine kinase
VPQREVVVPGVDSAVLTSYALLLLRLSSPVVPGARRTFVTPSFATYVSDVDAHRHRYRSPIAAIVGLAEAALQRDDLDAALTKQLRAIRGLAQEALDADRARRRPARTSPGTGADPD